MLRHILVLVKKELLLELRQQYALYGVLLYVASTVFVMYMALNRPEAQVWNALFWVLQLFITVSTVAKSFLRESPGRMLYFYSLVGAPAFIASKLIYNVILMWLMSGISLILYIILLGNPLIDIPLFIGVMALGSMSLALVFTMLSAIAARADQNAVLMAVMGFPIVTVELLLLIRITGPAFLQVYQPGLLNMAGLLAGMDVLAVGLSLILFPFLWKN